MSKITVKICPGANAGTNDYVKLFFSTCLDYGPSCKNKKFCETNWSDKSWQKGSTMEFYENHFGSCLDKDKENFRSLPALHAKAFVQQSESNSLFKKKHDDLTICHISVEFGDKSDKDHVHWEWTGEKQSIPSQMNDDNGATKFMTLSSG